MPLKRMGRLESLKLCLMILLPFRRMTFTLIRNHFNKVSGVKQIANRIVLTEGKPSRRLNAEESDRKTTEAAIVLAHALAKKILAAGRETITGTLTPAETDDRVQNESSPGRAAESLTQTIAQETTRGSKSSSTEPLLRLRLTVCL